MNSIKDVNLPEEDKCTKEGEKTVYKQSRFFK